MICIYKITSPTNKVYIGQTINFELRTRFYKYIRCKNQRKLYFSLKKHGWDNHKAEILLELREDIQPEMLTYWEQFFMDYYKGLGYNLLNLRDAGNKGKPSEETRRILSSYRGEKSSQYGKRGVLSPRYGLTLSAEIRQKLSEAARGDNHPQFKGYVLARKGNEFLGRYAGCTDAAKHLGIPPTSVWRSIKNQRPITRGAWKGYTFIREPQQ